jgi:putative hydrolase of the HAD superfamily
MKRRDQHLLIDGDDTLWECNAFFERAIEEFIDLVDHATLSRDEVRGVLDEIELARVAEHGYGAAGFARSLRECLERVAEQPVAEADLDRAEELGATMAEHPMEIIDGVEETLDYLAGRHRLLLVTKGDAEEQRLKVERSRLVHHFDTVVIVPEKSVDTYATLADEGSVERGRAWMIGNSPRSDVNPALAAGLNAVFVPHSATWRLEHEDIADGPGELLVVDSFGELVEHF